MSNKNLGNYFWYAVGEILLVVIGIVIALQIDNWNDGRIEQREVRGYLQNLVGDIRRDFEMLDPVEQQMNEIMSQANELRRYMQGKTLDEIHNIDLYTYMDPTIYRPYGWNRVALEQIKSSGALRQIKNPQLVTKISEYDALSRHLDQDFDGDRNGIEAANTIIMRIVNTNYPNADELDEFEDNAGEYDFKLFLASELYQRTKADDLALLTRDINVVISATNYYHEVVSNIQPRTSHEIPRLREYGQEIIDLVKAEYQ